MLLNNNFVILLVHDKPNERAALARSVIPDDCQLLLASNGVEALSVLEKCPVDLVVLEFHLPVLNAIEIVEQIKKLPRLRDLPIIVLSASPLTAREVCLRTGAAHCLTNGAEECVLRELIGQYTCAGAVNQVQAGANDG